MMVRKAGTLETFVRYMHEQGLIPEQMAVETLFAVWVTLFLLWTWPSVPWDLFQITTVILMVASPFAFFPFADGPEAAIVVRGPIERRSSN